MLRPPDLPEYNRPPIDEVALGVQFPIISGFSEAHIGLYWQQIRTQYPRVESQPRLETPIESLVPTESIPAPMSINLADPTHVQGRSWLISEDGGSLVQVQNSLFMHNWRRRSSEYPRFEHIWQSFAREFDQFRALLAAESLPQPEIQQLELSYFNWIVDTPMTRFLRPGEAARVSGPKVGPDPEDQMWLARYPVYDTTGDRCGAMQVSCQPGIRMDSSEKPVKGSQMVLTVRMPSEAFVGESSELLDRFVLAREAIVRSFSELTTVEAHNLWEIVE